MKNCTNCGKANPERLTECFKCKAILPAGYLTNMLETISETIKKEISVPDEIMEEWIKLYNLGIIDSQIAELYDVKENLVTYNLPLHIPQPNNLILINKKEILKNKFMELHDNGKTYQEIADIHSLNVFTIRKAISGYKRKKDTDMRNLCRELYTKGITRKKLCSSLHISKQVLSYRLLGLPMLPKVDYTEEWVELYNQGYSITDLTSKYHVSKSTIHKAFDGKVHIRHGVKSNKLKEEFYKRFSDKI